MSSEAEERNGAVRLFDKVCRALRTGDVEALCAYSLSVAGFPEGVDPWLGSPWLASAVEADNLATVAWVLGRGADPMAKSAGYTMLQQAIECGQNNRVAIMESLIAAGAELEQYGIFGYTAVHLAAEQDDLEALRFLIDRGANLHAPILVDPYGAEWCRSAADLAKARHPEGDVCRWLAQEGK